MSTTITLHGDFDANYVWGLSSKNNISSISDEYINAVVAQGVYSPEWDANTLMLATFQNGIDASDLSRKQITKYIIQRLRVGDDARAVVAETDADELIVCDFAVASDQTYEYYVIPVYIENDVEIVGQPIKTESINNNCINLSIVGLNHTDKNNMFTVDKDGIWGFNFNVTPGRFTPTYDKNILSNIGQYPKIQSGKANYLTGSFSALIGSVTCDKEDYAEDDIDKIKAWRAFCANGKPKLLRDEKGHVILCEITDTSYEYMQSTSRLPTSISFSFVEIGDSDSVSAYRAEG